MKERRNKIWFVNIKISDNWSGKLKKKTSQGTMDGIYHTIFLKRCMFRGQSLSLKVRGPGLRNLPRPTPHMKHIFVEI